MKRKTRISIAAVTVLQILLLIGLWRLWHSTQLNWCPSAIAVTNMTVATASVVKIKAPSQGLISKNEVMRQVWARENTTPQDFYGRVIDQYGAPVVDADVAGNMAWLQGYDIGEKTKTFTTKTDLNGEFKFTGISGWKLGVVPTKSGYELNLAFDTQAIKLPAGGKTSPESRGVFFMWKLKGPESLVHTEIDGRIPYDGRSVIFDLCSGKPAKIRVDNNESGKGDLRVTLARDPVDIKRGDRCNWNLRIEMVDGGLVEIADLYPNLAPETGYQQSVEFAGKKDDPQWNPRLSKSFYFHTYKGMFGRFLIDLIIDTARPEIGLGVGINIKAWINPSGSQNLEYDRTKEINLSQVSQRPTKM